MVGVLGFVFGLMSFVSRWKHLLSVLLSLEMMMMMTYYVVVEFSCMMGGMGWVGLIFLGVGVCEGALGLSLVVSLVRSCGGDCLLGFVGDVGNNV
uniref:NADH dehydrogenase subunit 4L n=1 Tax=Heterophrynus longicornis TaxID=1046789 RepID=UPI002410D8EC|nr:NADH dehydrogenase subunit 4L [Heterophrynus longicornis]WEM34679.1 NADH dehydrogenase subunit 4L [Heterophrynus longicornis]